MGTIVIDPRDFITGPFRTCPKCKGNEFGVLQVGGHHYIRRCRDRRCWHTESIDLPEIRKKVIYIDQFAISNMMKALNTTTKGHENTVEDPFWQELFEALDIACKLQLLICPDSDEHRSESLMSPFYGPLKRVYEHFSRGVSFCDSESIQHQQLIDLAAAWFQNEEPRFDLDPAKISSGRIHEWQDRFLISIDADYSNFVDAIRERRESTHDGLKNCFATWQQEKQPFAYWYAEEAKAYGRTTLQVYWNWARIRVEIDLGVRPFDIERYFPPQCASLISSLNFLFGRQGVPEADCIAKTVEFLLSDALEKAPCNRIESSLFAVLAMKAGAGQKTPPNKGTAADISVVSALLPYCDAMFVDNGCRALLSDIPKANKLPYDTQVFSLNCRDQFLEYLRNIIRQVPRQHSDLTKEVYGPDWIKPYTEMFKRKINPIEERTGDAEPE